MANLSVMEAAKKWGLSERSVRSYCAGGRIVGAYREGKFWQIPEDAEKPERLNEKKVSANLLERLRLEKKNAIKGGIYHKVQIDLTYNSNHIEGGRLSHDQTRYIYETNTIGMEGETIGVDDVLETVNHFRCIDLVIDEANRELNEHFIKLLHSTLKGGTSDSRKSWFRVGEYKKIPNEVGGVETSLPEKVSEDMRDLITWYNALKEVTFDNLLEFHYRFETIHPFQDGNGRVGRLILFKECLKHDICPFIIDDKHKMFYYRGLKEWRNQQGYLRDTCLLMQDDFKAVLDYFQIEYTD